MGLTTLGQGRLTKMHAFIFGEEGVGKTRLAMTLARVPEGKPRIPKYMRGVGIITIEPNGPQSLRAAGYPLDTPVFQLEKQEKAEDIREQTIYAIRKFKDDPKLHAVVLDGVTMLQLEMTLAIGGGAKLDWDGWAEILGHLQLIEREAEATVRKGKSFVWTSWETPPTMNEKPVQTDADGTSADEIIRGGPFIQGKGKVFVPGNVDILARMTSEVVVKDGKEIFQGKLQVKGSKYWKCKTRWNLPMFCRPDLQWILDQVNQQSPVVKK